jgi:glycosyltransferase involved in cell wall biosynthesis
MKSLSIGTVVPDAQFDLVCLSHLRWDFVYQRPQHLMSRFARQRRVYFVEEPTFGDDGPTRLDVSRREHGLRVLTPRLPQGMSGEQAEQAQRQLLAKLFADEQISQYVLWYYTPMAMAFTAHLTPMATVYDCMDELAAFKFAPPQLHEREAALFKRADLVFTGGQSLYEAKRSQHPRVYAFPSSVDVPHFAQAHTIEDEPADQRDLPHPRLGYFGVIDERMDIELLGGIAMLRPAWQIVMIGPTVKIDPAILPRPANIHYLGSKGYPELPAYIAGWEVAMLPFARNESTRFISPTKTPEYLAAGKPVVSTSIRDVVRPYGALGLVRIADTVAEFVATAEAAMSEDAAARQRRVDAFLAQMSWDNTWAGMNELIENVVSARLGSNVAAEQIGTPVSTA